MTALAVLGFVAAFHFAELALHLAQAVPVVIHDLSRRNFVVFEHFGGDALAGDDDLRFFIEILSADDDLKRRADLPARRIHKTNARRGLRLSRDRHTNHGGEPVEAGKVSVEFHGVAVVK